MRAGRNGVKQRARLRQRLTGPWPLAAAYVISATLACVVAARSPAGLTDLHVYRLGGDVALHGGNLYAAHYDRLPFTYPPFASVVFAAVAGLPWTLTAGLLLVASAVALAVMCYSALRLAPFPSWLQPADAARLALAAATLAIWLEPVRSTLSYGQVNLVLAAAVVADLALPDSSRFKGAAIGLAAAIKLTPAIFALYLLVTRRYRAAAVAAVVFAATLVIGYVVLPAGSAHYWDLNFLRSQRVSPVQNDTNQSLLGAIARDTGHVPGAFWLVVVALVAVTGLWLAARAHQRGDEAAGFGLCAVTGLLMSPISWTHHWVIAVPALLLAAVAAWRFRVARPRANGAPRPAAPRSLAVARLAGVAVLVVIGWSGLARKVPGAPGSWLHLAPFWLVVSQLYVIAGVLVLALAAWPAIARRLRGGGRGDHDGSSERGRPHYRMSVPN